MTRATSAALALAGFTAGMAQVLMARELLDVFYGDELCIGVLLGSWLLWVAVGSAVAARLGGRERPPDEPGVRGAPVLAFAILQLMAPLLLIGQIACARAIPAAVVSLRQWMVAGEGGLQALARLLPGTEGELIGLGPMTVCIALIMAPVCVIEGAQFVLGCRVYARERRVQGPADAIGRAYVWDAMGHLGAGAFLSCAFVYQAGSITHATVAGTAGAVVAMWLLLAGLRRQLPSRRLVRGMIAAAVVCGVLVLVGLSGATERLDEAMLRVRWRGRDLVAHSRTPYGSIAVTRRGSVHSFYASGLLMFDSPDAVGAEWLTHMAMLQHPRPRRVLLIGGSGGKLAEILKHGPERVDYVELDAEVVRLGKEYWAAEDAAALDDGAVKTHVTDGRAFVKADKGAGYDVVIVALPDPFTTRLSRFYSVEFFREVRDALSDDGVLCCSATSSPDYLGGPMLAYDACVVRSMEEAFGDVKAVPGDSMILLAAKRPGLLTRDVPALLERLHERGVSTAVFDSLLMDRMQQNRIEYVDRALASAPAVELNTDLRPRAYYYRQALSAAWFGPVSRRLFGTFRGLELWHFILLGGALALVLAPGVRRGRGGRVYVPALMASVGFAGMVLQVALLLAFQTVYGSVYHKIGLLTGAFMLGLAGGGVYMTRALPRVERPLLALAQAQLSVALYAALLAPGLAVLLRWSGHPAALGVLQIVFPLLTVMAGLLVGAAFPLAGKAQLEAQGEDRAEAGGAAGTLYAADLIGACVAGVLASTVLVPVLGMGDACLAAAVLCGPLGSAIVLRLRRDDGAH
jgi:spermidine synthase